MQKEQIFSNLKAKLGQTSLSERTINDYIERTMPKEGDPDEAWFATHSEILNSLGGNLSHDVASQVNEFKKNYKPSEPPTPPTPPAPTTPPANNPEIDALKNQLAELANAMKGMVTKNSQDALRASALSQAEALGANQGLWKMAVEQAAIADGATPESFLSQVKSSYEAMNKNVFGNNATPYGGGSPQEPDTKKEIDDFFASKGGPWASK